jgi:phosphoglycerate dehydrogenase-like enzyme
MRALILAPFSERCLARLRARITVDYESWLDTDVLHDPGELGARLRGDATSILVVEADFVVEELFAAAGELRFVGVCRNALNHVDLEEASARGVAVVHAPGRNTNAVVEMTLSLMLALARRVASAHALVSGGGWRDPAVGYRRLRGREVAGSTVGVVGFGQIGREVARACVALGARVVAHDPVVSAQELRDSGAEPSALAPLLAASDFVTLHVPEIPETHHMADAAFFASMKRDAFLINTGSGAAVNPVALARALERGEIAGAALDVFEGHPLPQSSPLMMAPNLIMTPHIGGATAETIERHSQIITDEIERFLDGKPLLHAVTADPVETRGG